MSHVRYPADLFKVQRAILGTYHVTDAGSFYSRDDAWATPNDPTRRRRRDAAAAVLPDDADARARMRRRSRCYSTFIPRVARATAAATC